VSEPPRVLCLSTQMFPERGRFSAFREMFARRVVTMDVVDRCGARPRIDVTVLPLEPVAVANVAATASEFVRNPSHIKDGRDTFRLDIVVGVAPIQYAHAGKERIYACGEAHFGDHGRPLRIYAPSGGSIRSITVRTAALKTLVANPEDLAGCFVRPGPALNLLAFYLQSLATLAEPPPLELSGPIGTHILDLMSAALGPTSDAREIIAERGVKAARLRALSSKIAQRCGAPGFDLDSLAASLGLSRRHVQRLLMETGKSFTQHVAERRLRRAHAMLTDWRSEHLRVIDIALSVGFNDVSHFNRMFRRLFGDTPSAVRATAQTERQIRSSRAP
jgi:AraC-like DNA-binding protein